MLGATLRFEQSRGDDRFYSCPKGRRNGGLGRQRRRCNGATDLQEPAVATPEHQCNLERFLGATTPSVDARYISKMTMSCWRTCNVEYYPYYDLGDLWESFRECSVYGTGVNLVLDAGIGVMQYYVPYLSGIQLFGEHQKMPEINTRKLGDDSDGYYPGDSSSDDSSDGELDAIIKYPKDMSRFYPFNSYNHKMDSSLAMKNNALSEGLSSDESEVESARGHLLFEYFEQDVPCARVPLADKISYLSNGFPGLNTLRSCELLPASWMSVAWYPIYRIPTGSTLRDLDACFLTFHSLSTPPEGSHAAIGPIVTFPDGNDSNPKITLPVFGLATYKFKGSVWMQNTELQRQLPDSLLLAADNWLRLLQVNHPDFQFFVSNGTFRR